MSEIIPPHQFADLASTDMYIPPWVHKSLVGDVMRQVDRSGKEIVSSQDGIELSVVIPTRSGRPQIEALKSVLSCSHRDGESTEVVLALGDQPSIQRNMAISLTRGRLIGFLDDDCLVADDWTTRAMAIFTSRDVAMAGGPNLTPEDSSFFSTCVGRVLSSRWGTAMMRARYAPVGEDTKLSGDERTALCNMVFKRELFADSGFDESLFPNEENELIVRLTSSGHRLLYDPGLRVTHPRKEGWRSFARQFFGYGSGRAWQTKIQPESLRPIHLMPSLTLLGLLALPVLEIMRVGPPILNATLCAMLLLYIALVSLSGAWIGIGMRSIKAFLLSMILYPTLHFSYGLGFLLRMVVPRGKDRPQGNHRIWMLRLAVKSAGH